MENLVPYTGRESIPRPNIRMCWAFARSMYLVGIGMLRSGSRYVEGCWGFPYLKIEKSQNVHFMFLIDIKLTLNILNEIFRGSSSLSGARLCKT